MADYETTRAWDRELLAKGWTRVRTFDFKMSDGKVERRAIYSHPDHPNDCGDGWTAPTALMMSDYWEAYRLEREERENG